MRREYEIVNNQTLRYIDPSRNDQKGEINIKNVIVQLGDPGQKKHAEGANPEKCWSLNILYQDLTHQVKSFEVVLTSELETQAFLYGLYVVSDNNNLLVLIYIISIMLMQIGE